MKLFKRVLKWTVGVLCVAILTTAAVVALLAWRRPADYKPIVLTAQQQQQAQVRMYGRVQEFLDRASLIGSTGGNHDPATIEAARAGGIILPDGTTARTFTMQVTQQEASEWIASLPVQVIYALNRLGLRDPAIAFGPDRLTVYVFSAKQNGVIGLDFGFEFTPDQMMRLQLRDVRMGELKLPRSVYDDLVRDLEQRIQQNIESATTGQDDENAQIAGVAVSQVRNAVAAMLTSLHGEPVDTDLRDMHIGHVRIADIQLEPELLTVHVESTLDPAQALPRFPGQGSAEDAAEGMDFNLD